MYLEKDNVSFDEVIYQDVLSEMLKVSILFNLTGQIRKILLNRDSTACRHTVFEGRLKVFRQIKGYYH